MNDALCWQSAAELARAIRTKQVSTIDVVRTHRDRIAALNPRLNAIVALNPHLEKEARAAEAAVMKGHELGPLHGVPFTVKDCIDTAGIETTRGSRLFAHYVPSTDATAVRRLKAAGGILLAKTNVPEFSFDRETANVVLGRSVNPWNPNRTPGGSSGGEAVAIASGLSPLGVGSDLAVSIRGPAHYCGIVGLKATHGRIPLSGHWPETLRRFWHVGPMARTVGDVALALRIMSGPDGCDPHAWPAPPPGAIEAESPLPRLRVGWLAERGFGPVDQEVVATVGRAAQLLEEVGCEVVPGDPRGFEQRDCNALTARVFRPLLRVGRRGPPGRSSSRDAALPGDSGAVVRRLPGGGARARGPAVRHRRVLSRSRRAPVPRLAGPGFCTRTGRTIHRGRIATRTTRRSSYRALQCNGVARALGAVRVESRPLTDRCPDRGAASRRSDDPSRRHGARAPRGSAETDTRVLTRCSQRR
jgi:Asp-tRNA(Asn)/Glu-tRNA(Gln) amidotransferase A subunit family amidase